MCAQSVTITMQIIEERSEGSKSERPEKVLGPSPSEFPSPCGSPLNPSTSVMGEKVMIILKYCAKGNGIVCIVFGNKLRNARFVARMYSETHTHPHSSAPGALRSWFGPFDERSLLHGAKNTLN